MIADNALLGGFAAGQRPVTSRIVREVCRDFDLTLSDSGEPPVAAQPASTGTEDDGSLLMLRTQPAARRQRSEKADNGSAPDRRSRVADVTRRRRRSAGFALSEA